MKTTTRARSTLALSACLGLALASTAAAQAQPPGTSAWVEPEVTVAGLFERTGHGDFDGDGVQDMVVHCGTSLEVLLAPGLYDQRLVVPVPATAYGVCSSAPGAPRSVLLVAGPLGLQQLTLDVASGTWDVLSIAHTWGGASLIEVREMVNTVGVLGVLADRRTVRTVYRLEGQWFEQAMLVHPEAIRDLTVFEFDGAGQIEIAVASDSGLWVYDALGKVRQFFPVGDAQSVAIGRLKLPKTPRDGIAWVVTRTEGVQQLIVLSPSGLQPPKHLANLPFVVDIATGDIDFDGDSDIVLSHTVAHNVIVLLNLGDGWTTVFDTVSPGGVRELPYGPEGEAAPENSARPSLVDVDGDEDRDLLMPVQSTGELFVWRSDTVEQELFEPEVDLGTLETSCNLESLGNGDLAMHLKLGVDLPENATATHIEVVVWHRACPEDPTEPVAVQRVLVPIAGNDPQVLDAQIVLPQVPDLVPGSDVRFEGMYLWLQRAVRVYNGAVSHRWPSRVYAIETSPAPDNYSWIKQIGGKMLFPIHQCVNGGTLPDLIGCGSELPKLPEFPGGKVPTWI